MSSKTLRLVVLCCIITIVLCTIVIISLKLEIDKIQENITEQKNFVQIKQNKAYEINKHYEEEIESIKIDRTEALRREEQISIKREQGSTGINTVNQSDNSLDDRNSSYSRNYSSQNNIPSWLQGHWRHIESGNYSVNVYIEGSILKVYFTEMYGRPQLAYNGTFTYSRNNSHLNGWDCINYTDSYILVDSRSQVLVWDDGRTPYTKVR